MCENRELNSVLIRFPFNIVSISFANYRAVHPSLKDESDAWEDDIEDSDEEDDDGKSVIKTHNISHGMKIW